MVASDFSCVLPVSSLVTQLDSCVSFPLPVSHIWIQRALSGPVLTPSSFLAVVIQNSTGGSVAQALSGSLSVVSGT